MKSKRIEFDQIPALEKSVCALGYFDGVHRGHRQLMETAIAKAKAAGIQSAVLTFDPDPWQVLKPNADLHHLSDLEDKAMILESMGIDCFYIVNFTREFAGLSNEQFHQFLKDLNITEVVCGFDYTYGKKGSGNIETLRKDSGLPVDVIEQISDHEEKISSSRIEALIREGNVEEAGELLGYLYTMKGTVESGFQRGRKLGFPTANLSFSKEELCPASGVYAGYVLVKNHAYKAMINVGTNPTFNNREKTIEAHLFDYSGSLYGKKVRFLFARRLRSEIRFASVEDLKEQLRRDEKASLKALALPDARLDHTVNLWSLDGLDGILEP